MVLGAERFNNLQLALESFPRLRLPATTLALPRWTLRQGPFHGH